MNTNIPNPDKRVTRLCDLLERRNIAHLAYLQSVNELEAYMDAQLMMAAEATDLGNGHEPRPRPDGMPARLTAYLGRPPVLAHR
jgi:hypothetical protein